eukprot:16436680-Heterocapsa_arctica.AAC.1
MALLPPGSLILIRGSTEDQWFERYVLAQVEGPTFVFVKPGAEFYTEELECLWTSTWTWEELATQLPIYGGPPVAPTYGSTPVREPVYGFWPRPTVAFLGDWVREGTRIARIQRALRGLSPQAALSPRAGTSLGA